jgi:hypothetical protein
MPKRPEPKMSLLEYIVHRELGQPTGLCGGVPCWPCPVHGGDAPKFYLSADKRGKVRFHCWSHGCWGDEADLLKALYGDGWKWRSKLDVYRVEWERNPKTFYYEGRAEMVSAVKKQRDDGQHNMQAAFAEWLSLIKSPLILTCSPGHEAEVSVLRMAFELTEIAKRNHVSHEALLADIAQFYKWCRDMDDRHMAECADPDCENLCCIAERHGLEAALAARDVVRAEAL